MALPIGTRLGPFELTGSLGAGGMGEVYRALDTKLNREVALKVLPDHLIDPDRLLRFRREAQVVASLNHPNIAAIYGLEDSGDKPALVLELVEGPTLADRIAQGPLPIEESIAITRQIADALEAAHEQGIVHRDLKPANIKLRPDGTVKVLDFGLAKLTESGPVRSSVDPTLSPTLTAMTGIGVILGTAAYMAPEQAAGKQADKRADIWAFGVVLWEMLTGERLFASTESTSHVLADVLRAPIDFEKVPSGPLRDLLRRCLDRDVKTRLRDIGEARVALSRPLVSSVVRDTTTARRRVPVAWAALSALLAVSTGVVLWAPWRTEPDRALVKLDVDLGLGPDVALPPSTLARTVFVSPDGARLMYMASVAGGPMRLYVRRLEDDSEKTIELPGTDGVTAATFSRDSRSVGFAVGTRVYRISVDGGAALRLSETENPSNQITWGDGDVILVSGIYSGLVRIPPTPGMPTPLTKLIESEAIHASPEVLPGGKTVLFIAGGPTDVTTIEAVPAGGGMRKVIIPNGLAPHYIPTGHLLYLLKDTLFAVRFDPDTLRSNGDAVPIMKGVKTTMSGAVAVGGFSVAGNGTVVYRKANGGPDAGIVGSTQAPMTVQWIVGEKRTPLVSTPGAYLDVQLSPDGSQIAMTRVNSSGPDVVVFDPKHDSAPRAISFDSGTGRPTWIGKDGRYLVSLYLGTVPRFGREGRIASGLSWRRTDGGNAQAVLPDLRAVATGSFSIPAGRLAVVARAAGNRRNIFTVSVTEDADQLKFGTPERFSPEQFSEYDPQYSRDGRWVAFVSDRSGHEEVYVRATMAPPNGVRYERQISTEGGTNPRWSRTRDELLYQSGQQILSVPYTVRGEVLEPDKPTVRIKDLGSTVWDLAPDGRIAAIVPLTKATDAKAQPPEHTFVLIQNFFDEVRRRVK